MTEVIRIQILIQELFLCPWHTCRKLARVIRRWKLANVTCFPALFLARAGI